jgi:hypothetical protein
LLFSGLKNILSMYKMPCLTTMSQGANLTLDNFFRRRQRQNTIFENE